MGAVKNPVFQGLPQVIASRIFILSKFHHMIKSIAIAAFAGMLIQASVVFAQTPQRIKTTVKTTPGTQIPPQPTTAPNSWDYFLTSAKVTICTGNDNKEKPSQVQMQMAIGGNAACNYLVPTSQYREFGVNSVVDLPFSFLIRTAFPDDKPRLGHIEQGGIKFWIYYSPNFPLDAWKIEKVVLTLEFKDATGNPHPIVGTKSITFMDVRATLNREYTGLRCEADGFMMSKGTAVIK